MTAARGLGAVAVGFGLLTVFVGGSVVFDVGGARAAHGDFVPFVLYFNFLSGFVYVAAGVGLALGRWWAKHLALGLAAAIAATGLALGVHIADGGHFETETVGAMGFRLTVWLALSAWAWTRRPTRS